MRYGWAPYVSASEKRRKAARTVAKLEKQGRSLSPVELEGRTIAKTFWGKAWCDNLESYSDYSNRLPRGRTYVRNGSVLDLQIGSGGVKALVNGSRLYVVSVKTSPVSPAGWRSICQDCAGAIDSLIELLQGRFSQRVMERLCRQRSGLFPSPDDIRFSCDCPDWAGMCKHVAAVLYGVGARLDTQPEFLFRLRKVDEKDLVAHAGSGMTLSTKKPAASKILASDDLSNLFNLDLAKDGHAVKGGSRRVGGSRRQAVGSPPGTKKKASAKKPAAQKTAAVRDLSTTKTKRKAATKGTTVVGRRPSHS